MADDIKSSTAEKLYTERTFPTCTFWLIFTRKQIRMCEMCVPNLQSIYH